MSQHTAAMRYFTMVDLRSMVVEMLHGVTTDPAWLVELERGVDEIDFNAVTDAAIEATAVVMTEEEIEALVAFYETPTGASIRRKLPQLQVAVLAAIRPLLEHL